MLFDSLRNKSGKSLIYRGHTKSEHPVIDLMLESYLIFVPLPGHSSVDSSHITHSHPREMCRTCEIGIDLFLTKAELRPDAGKNCLSCNRSQRHTETVKRNPVYFILPFFPSPERSCITISTYIVIQTVTERRSHNRTCGILEFSRKFKTIASPARNSISIRKDVIIESLAQCHS